MMLRHMLPNALGPVIVITTFSVAGNILVVSALSYLGIGIVPPTAEWGSILSAAKPYISSAPWFLLFPGITIMLSVFAINLFGDGLRDALDPRLK
jgi:peptide/nickel transport system permease protein